MAESGDFKWDRESTVIAQVDAVAVYTNPDGDIVIRQNDSVQGEDHIIVIPVAYASTLIEAIKKQVG